MNASYMIYPGLYGKDRRRQNFSKEIGDRIIKEACSFRDITPDQLKSSCRFRHYVDTRAIAVRYMRDTYGWSFQTMGNFINKDHSTVIHLLRNTRNITEVKELYDQFCKHLDERGL